jgi:glyoxylase-like metal-dependent hydrolase (beta-lactamase superfamily II)
MGGVMRMPAVGEHWIDQRRAGGAVVTVISDGVVRWAPRFAVPEPAWREALPEADTEGRIPLGLNLVMVDIGEATLVVDPAFDAPGSRHERQFARWAGLEVERTPGLDVALTALDRDPAAVTHVVVTHPHSDHIGGLLREVPGGSALRFPHARHWLGAADRDDDPASAMRRPLREVAQAGLLEFVEGEREIAPGVTLVPAPGETPGHQVVRVDADGDTFWIVGDLVHHACEVRHPGWAPPHADAARVLATRQALFPRIAASGGLVIVPHAPFPGWNRLLPHADGYRLDPA